jgi:hypothetical protein
MAGAREPWAALINGCCHPPSSRALASRRIGIAIPRAVRRTAGRPIFEIPKQDAPGARTHSQPQSIEEVRVEIGFVPANRSDPPGRGTHPPHWFGSPGSVRHATISLSASMNFDISLVIRSMAHSPFRFFHRGGLPQLDNKDYNPSTGFFVPRARTARNAC